MGHHHRGALPTNAAPPNTTSRSASVAPLAARTYLVSLGVPADRLRTVSYGKEFPFDPGHDEAAWAKNRRAQFVLTSKSSSCEDRVTDQESAMRVMAAPPVVAAAFVALVLSSTSPAFAANKEQQQLMAELRMLQQHQQQLQQLSSRWRKR